MNNTLRIFGGLTVVMLLHGCVGSSKATRFYAFDNSDAAGSSETNIILSVDIFDLPEYLNRPQIVIRTSESDIKLLNFDRWAEPLDLSVTRRMLSQLDRKLTNIFVYSVPGITGIDPDYQLRGRLAKFEANSDGVVELQAHWGVTDKDNNFVIRPTMSVYDENNISVNDVSEIVKAMGRLLDRLAADIASKMHQHKIG